MIHISSNVIIAALIILIFCSGCISQPSAPSPGDKGVTGLVTPVESATAPQATPPVLTGTPIPTTVIQMVNDQFPQDVTNLPAPNAIDIGIDKDRVYNTITVTFIGGPGQILVKNILVRVTTSDGNVQEKIFSIINQVATGASVDMKGTQGSDRVEVFVTLNGVIYKVKDQNMVYGYY